MDLKTVGAKLKELRCGQNLTQEQLAEKFGVSARSVSRWETGNNMPDISILIELSEYYGVELGDILGTEKERKSEKMEENEKRTIEAVSDYKDEKQVNYQKRLMILIPVAIICAIGAEIVAFLGIHSIMSYVFYGALSGVSIGVLIAAFGFMARNNKEVKVPKKASTLSIILCSILVLLILLSLAYLICIIGVSADVNVETDRVISIENSVSDTDVFEFGFDIEEADCYKISWNITGEVPGFIHGITVEDENGKIINVATMDIGSSELNGTNLEPGTYKVRFRILETEEEYRAFAEEKGGFYPTPLEDVFSDGDFLLHYELKVVKK